MDKADSRIELLTEQETADLMRRSAATISRYRRLRIGPPYIRMQGRVLYDRNAVEAWLQAQSVQAGAA